MLNLGNFLFANLPATTTATTIGNTPLTGLLGVGTSSPYAKLTVWGGDTLSTSKAFEIANSASSTLFSVSNSGNVGVGTTSLTYSLHVATSTVGGVVARFENGTGYCDINPTTTALVCTSDATLKKNVATIDRALDSITALRGITFNWNNEDEQVQRHVGFLAQEVEKVLPELVATDTMSGKKSVNYIGFTPVLVEAIKELATRVSSLEARISQGVSRGIGDLKDLIVDTLTARKVVTDTLEMKDSATNEIYCIKITNGEWDKSKGACGNTPENNQASVVQATENEPVVPEEPAAATSPTESEADPAPSIESDAIEPVAEVITETPTQPAEAPTVETPTAPTEIVAEPVASAPAEEPAPSVPAETVAEPVASAPANPAPETE